MCKVLLSSFWAWPESAMDLNRANGGIYVPKAFYRGLANRLLTQTCSRWIKIFNQKRSFDAL